MTHLWIRAEPRANESRVGITPEGVATLLEDGVRVTIEDSACRCIPTDAYAQAGAEIAAEGSWRDAPGDAFVFGLKELPDDGTPLRHRHIMFGHAYKGQPNGQRLLARFWEGRGVLYDLEYLVEGGRRVAAFGYWAGFAGAAMSLMAWAAQAQGAPCPRARVYASAEALKDDARGQLKKTAAWPTVLVIGAKGRVGAGASDLCTALSTPVTRWDMKETAHGGPFPELLMHHVFLNCVLTGPGTPVFVPADAGAQPRRLTVIGDIACDPGSEVSPVRVYDRTTTWDTPVLRVHDSPPLDVMAIDNLPSMLPVEASEDFAAQLLPYLRILNDIDGGVWKRARDTFDTHRP